MTYGVEFSTEAQARDFVESEQYQELRDKNIIDLSLSELCLLAACEGGVGYSETKTVREDNSYASGSSGPVGETTVDEYIEVNFTRYLEGTRNPEKQQKLIEAMSSRLIYGNETVDSITLPNWAQSEMLDSKKMISEVSTVLFNKRKFFKGQVALYKAHYESERDKASAEGQKPNADLEGKLNDVNMLSTIINNKNLDDRTAIKNFTEVFFEKADSLAKRRDSGWLKVGKVIGLALLTMVTCLSYGVYAGIQAIRGKPISGWSSEGEKFVAGVKERAGHVGHESAWEHYQKEAEKKFENDLFEAHKTNDALQNFKTQHLELLGGLVSSYANGQMSKEEFMVKGQLLNSKIERIDKTYEALKPDSYQPEKDQKAYQNAVEQAEKDATPSRNLGKVGLQFLNGTLNEADFLSKVNEVAKPSSSPSLNL